ncbi:MAG: flagellar biosynthetic protein FliO [Sphingomonas sp.]|uniref:flagellar biosynthetic protein FliO n=1 Tax=Sphingomonas sp. TaxID=28214 RepID=UPI002276CFC4|nr:flagellar biosynthetic protein FliO [Sphingomonas sp.]MCX8475469.1 flagellar biosynthetic protein FliO [Sphingomonas sp.]
MDVSLTRIVMALVLGTMLAVLAALAIKRGGGRFDMAVVRRLFVALPTERRIHVIESRRVSQHADLCLVRCDGEEYLILSSAQQQQILRTGVPADAPSEGAPGEDARA